MGLEFVEAVIALDEDSVRDCLHREPQIFRNDVSDTNGLELVLHKLLSETDVHKITQALCRRTLIYLLRCYGLDVNIQDQDGNTPLHLVLQRVGDTEVCEALLQCGADMYIKNKNGMTPLEIVQTQSKIPDRVRELVLKYKPGLWRAVQDDDLMSVRKLINLWCRVDLQKNGRSLKEQALSKGTEHIIRLIKDINPSMRLAHAAMAGDLATAKSVCAEGSQVNVNFRNLGDMGATPLFYAIINNNHGLVELLCQQGAKIDATITFDDIDIPLYFTALTRSVDPDIIKCLTPAPDKMEHFSKLHYKGRNVLHYCIENDISPGVIRHLLMLGYPELVAARAKDSLCAWEMAHHMDKSEYVQIIDEVVHEWYLDNSDTNRHVLAIQGYPYLKNAQKDGVKAHDVILSMETSSNQAKFDSDLDHYQDHIWKLHEAVEGGDLHTVESLVMYTGQNSYMSGHCQGCLANSRTKGDGQPLLHKAVLRQHAPIVQLLASSLVNKVKVKVDSVIDVWHRTALHYAYAIPSAKDIVYILQDYGCSDFTLDKDMRSPLVFRDHRQSLEMHQLIQYHINKTYTCEEPSPWKILKIPLVGHDQICRHRNLRHLTHGETKQNISSSDSDKKLHSARSQKTRPHDIRSKDSRSKQSKSQKSTSQDSKAQNPKSESSRSKDSRSNGSSSQSSRSQGSGSRSPDSRSQESRSQNSRSNDSPEVVTPRSRTLVDQAPCPSSSEEGEEEQEETVESDSDETNQLLDTDNDEGDDDDDTDELITDDTDGDSYRMCSLL